MDPTGKIAKPHKTFVTVKLYRNYVCNHAYIQIYSRTHIYLREGRPVLGKIAYRLRVKAVLRSPKSQQVASRCAGTLKKVCKAVVAKKGAHSGF